MTERRLVAVSAGLSQPSATRLLADRVTSAAERHLREGGVEPRVEHVELREFAHDLTNNLLTSFPSPRLRAAIDAVIAADGLIAVTPIFTASYSGLFKVFFDVLEEDSLAEKPVVIAASGGTARHSLALDHALRPLFAYLGANVVPTAVFAAAEDWGSTGQPMDGNLVDRIDRAGRELAAAITARPSRSPIDPFGDPIPFEEMLRATSRPPRIAGADRDTS
jgi:FMN reductase